MAKLTEAEIEELGKKAMDAIGETFEFTDLFEVVPLVMQMVERVEGMTSEEKEETAGALLDYVVDETDTPWLPDNLVDPWIKKGFRAMMPVVCKLTKGFYRINDPKTGKD